MLFRKAVFVLVILFFAAIALILFVDLVRARKKIDKQGKKNKAKAKANSYSKKTYYH